MTTNMKKTNNGTRTLRQPVEQIWLAGLGALAVTEEEGGKLFKSLVKKGQGFEKDTKVRFDDAFEATKSVPRKAMTRIEHGVTDTFENVLHRLGVPSRREINSLTRRVETLATTLEKSSARPRRPRARSTKRPAETTTTVTS